MLAQGGTTQKQINAAFQPNSTGWAGLMLARVRREIARSALTAFHDSSGSTQRLRRANALPVVFGDLDDVEIPDPDYRGEIT